MKHATIFLTISILSITPSFLLAQTQAVLALAPYQPPSHREELQSVFFNYLLTDAAPLQRFTFIDGWDSREIADITIPDLRRDNVRARLQAIGNELAALRTWFANPSLPHPELADTGALNTPAIFAAMERYGDADALLLIGSPIYRSPTVPLHSWYFGEGERAGYWYPSDAHFYAPRGRSPWAVANNHEQLSGVRVHWLIDDDHAYPRGIYEAHILRFYRLLVGLQGGELVRFPNTPREALAHLFDDDLSAVADYIDPEQTVIEMRRAEDRIRYNDELDNAEDAVEMPADAPTERQAWLRSLTVERAPSVEAGQADATALAESVIRSMDVDIDGTEVGISLGWDAPVDFDLIVFPGGGAEPLYFGNRSSSEGRYLKDRRTPEDFQYEEVVLTSYGSDAEAWVNLHSVNEEIDEPPSGEYFIVVDRVTYLGDFSFGVRRGDRGEGFDYRENSPFWARLDLSSLPDPTPLDVKEPLH